jgi:hypothetical protein
MPRIGNNGTKKESASLSACFCFWLRWRVNFLCAVPGEEWPVGFATSMAPFFLFCSHLRCWAAAMAVEILYEGRKWEQKLEQKWEQKWEWRCRKGR